MPNVVVTTYPPTWNMQQLQFANIQLALEGTPFAFFQEIEYSTSISVEEGRGVSPYPMGTTTGSASFSASISVQLAMREPFMKIISALSPDGNSWGDALFNVQVAANARGTCGTGPPPDGRCAAGAWARRGAGAARRLIRWWCGACSRGRR